MPRTKTVSSTKRKKNKKKSKLQEAEVDGSVLGSGRSGSSNNQAAAAASFSAKQLHEAAEQILLTGSDAAEQAIALYTAALSVPVDRMDMDAVFLLEKRAEAKVSISDQDGAKSDYQQALQTLQEQQPKQEAHQQQQEEQGSHLITTDPSVLERMASLHLYMGQLSGGDEALQAYQQGIQLLRQSLDVRKQPQLDSAANAAASKVTDAAEEMSSSDDYDTENTRRQLAAACCSVAEVYLTDLCMQDDAEQECERHVQEALQVCPTSVDALQTAANLRLSQCGGGGEEEFGNRQTAQAFRCMLDCFAQIREPCQALARLVGMDAAQKKQQQEPDGPLELDPNQVQAVQALPGFEFRCQTAKLLLECSALLSSTSPKQQGEQQHQHQQALECAEAAVTVLGSLLAENDEVIEVWFLAGDAFASEALKQAETARYYYERAAEMLQAVQQQLQQEQQEQQQDDSIMDMDDEEEEQDEETLQLQLDEVTCQLASVQEKLQNLSSSAAAAASSKQDKQDEPMT